MIDVICLELETLDGFESVRKKHYGIERISKIFFDNLPTGTCFRCSELPSCRNEDFLFLKLTVPRSQKKIELVTLIQSHCTVDPNFLWMKCSNCCPHAQICVPCPQTGFCKRKATTKTELLELPEYLLISLLRFGESMAETKVDTVVEFGEKVIFPAGDTYSPISNISHLGQSLNGGHYVNFTKSVSGQWWLLDDAKSNKVPFEQVTNSSSYIILLKKDKPNSIDNLQNEKRDSKVCSIPDKADKVQKRAMSGQELSLKSQVLEPKDQNLRTERKRHAVVDYVSQKRKKC